MITNVFDLCHIPFYSIISAPTRSLMELSTDYLISSNKCKLSIPGVEYVIEHYKTHSIRMIDGVAVGIGETSNYQRSLTYMNYIFYILGYALKRSKHQEGDIVKLRRDLKEGERYGSLTCLGKMKEQAGATTYVIKRSLSALTQNYDYRLYCHNYRDFWWNEVALDQTNIIPNPKIPYSEDMFIDEGGDVNDNNNQ